MLSLMLPREAGLCLTQAVTCGLESWHGTDIQPFLAAHVAGAAQCLGGSFSNPKTERNQPTSPLRRGHLPLPCHIVTSDRKRTEGWMAEATPKRSSFFPARTSTSKPQAQAPESEGCRGSALRTRTPRVSAAVAAQPPAWHTQMVRAASRKLRKESEAMQSGSRRQRGCPVDNSDAGFLGLADKQQLLSSTWAQAQLHPALWSKASSHPGELGSSPGGTSWLWAGGS